MHWDSATELQDWWISQQTKLTKYGSDQSIVLPNVTRDNSVPVFGATKITANIDLCMISCCTPKIVFPPCTCSPAVPGAGKGKRLWSWVWFRLSWWPSRQEIVVLRWISHDQSCPCGLFAGLISPPEAGECFNQMAMGEEGEGWLGNCVLLRALAARRVDNREFTRNQMFHPAVTAKVTRLYKWRRAARHEDQISSISTYHQLYSH